MLPDFVWITIGRQVDHNTAAIFERLYFPMKMEDEKPYKKRSQFDQGIPDMACGLHGMTRFRSFGTDFDNYYQRAWACPGNWYAPIIILYRYSINVI